MCLKGGKCRTGRGQENLPYKPQNSLAKAGVCALEVYVVGCGEGGV